MALTDNQLVMMAGRKYRHKGGVGVKSLRTGQWNRVLQAAAQEHAAYQARVQVQEHQGWSRRVIEIANKLPEYKGFAEICAESWPENSRDEAATELFYSWERSPGHWSVANGRCDIWGYAMAKGRNGIWYGCGIVGFER